MAKVVDVINRTDEYIAFINDLRNFHAQKGTTLQAEPVLGGKKLDLLVLYKSVVAAGGFDQVTKSRNWKHVGDIFNFPSTCTNSAYILKGLYIRNLLGWEEENVWGKTWIPPKELLGPNAHKASTLAGKTYKNHQSQKHCHHTTTISHSYTPIKPDQTSQHIPVDVFAWPPGFPDSAAADLCPPFGQIAITDKPHQCAISELHHQSQPLHHFHSLEDSANDPAGHVLNDNDRRQILYSLQSGSTNSVHWALSKVVTISFECPDQLRLDRVPMLLDVLLSLAEPALQACSADGTVSNNSATSNDHILKILHIVRNFSFIDINAQILATHARLKAMVVKSLVGTSPHHSHCIDILENISSYIELTAFDEYISCLVSFVYANERRLVIGSVRILTTLALNEKNHFYLLSGSAHIAERIAHLLVMNDEELIGTALEYLYQYTRISSVFRLQLLTMHSGADIGILVSLLMAKTKYFTPRIIREDQEMSPSPPQPLSPRDSLSNIHMHGNVPCVPNLGAYQQLDEPYRCLGWLKDKFEVADPSSVLSLDDMYLLYEMRFGHEKALKMKDFYTVLKIAFPIASSTSKTSPATTGPIFEGISVRGIQIKISILQDGSELLCQWTDCSQTFSDELNLQRHVIRDHIGQSDKTSGCMWIDCAESQEFRGKDEMASHLSTHFEHEQGPVQTSPTFYIDNSDIQGTALVAAHLLRLLSKDAHSHVYFMPYEKELTVIAQQRPKLAPYIRSMFSSFCLE
ncbi:Chromatin structure-remodeling complex protein rsc9 [Apophysomyces ossiformis]|uniref:Chromatin structure-remodeling complex protein rsc9 n=1 Tax=Apophysomyces ossiformis TaxID=679940 RepID=A0A8H7BNU0_9FUNG|nr:Chromatin structure-remodeling complex protein rsc9 [Apophysomyces ossiformis]